MTLFTIVIGLTFLLILAVILIYFGERKSGKAKVTVTKSIGRNILFGMFGGGLGLVVSAIFTVLLCGMSSEELCALGLVFFLGPIAGIIGIIFGLLGVNIARQAWHWYVGAAIFITLIFILSLFSLIL